MNLRSRKQVYEWCDRNLSGYLSVKRYPGVFERLRHPKYSQRWSAVAMSVFYVLLTERRPERSEVDRKRYEFSNCITKVEMADIIGCSASAVQRACADINDVVIATSVPGTDAAENGLILFRELGSCIRPTFGDAASAKIYSGKQIRSLSRRHNFNIKLAAENEPTEKPIADDERVKAFKMLTPEQQQRLLATIGLQ